MALPFLNGSTYGYKLLCFIIINYCDVGVIVTDTSLCDFTSTYEHVCMYVRCMVQLFCCLLTDCYWNCSVFPQLNEHVRMNTLCTERSTNKLAG